MSADSGNNHYSVGGLKRSFCFNQEVFSHGDDIDAASLVTDIQGSGVPLETFLSDLQSYLSSLKQDLYDLINRDYADFILISSGLAGLETKVKAVSHPIDTLEESIKLLAGTVKDRADELSSSLGKRSAIREEVKEVLLSFRYLSSLAIAEHLLGIKGEDVEGEEVEVAGKKVLTACSPISMDARCSEEGKVDKDNNLLSVDSIDSWGDEDIEGEEESDSDSEKEKASVPSLAMLLKGALIIQREGGEGVQPPTISNKQLRSTCEGLERASHYSLMLMAARQNTTKEHTVSVEVLGSIAGRADKVESEVKRQWCVAFAEVISPLGRVQRNLQNFSSSSSSRPPLVDTISFMTCIRAFAALGYGEEAEQQFGLEAIQPLIEERFTVGNVDGGVRGSSQGLPSLINEVMEHVEKGSNVLVAAETLFVSTESSIDGGERNLLPACSIPIDLICNGIWSRLVDGIIKRIPSIFSPGIADGIHRNYNIMQGLLHRLSMCCGPDLESSLKQRLAAHPSTADLLSHWNLPVYFQLRFHEITSTVDESLGKSGASLETDTSPKPEFGLAVTCTMWECMVRCFSEGVFLVPVAHRFTRLLMQLLERYATWVSERAVGEEGNEQTAVLLVSDMVTLGKRATGKLRGGIFELHDMITERLPSEEARKLVLEAITSVCCGWDEKVKDIWDKSVAHPISERCCSMLRAVKGITATYRMTNRAPPTVSSPFVSQVMQPLKEFLGQWNHIVLEGVSGWEIRVIVRVATYYRDSVRELLTAVLHQEETLRKHKGGRGARRTSRLGGTSSISDTEKILIQLRLDAKAFEEDIQSMGFDIKNCVALQEMTVEVNKSPSELGLLLGIETNK